MIMLYLKLELNVLKIMIIYFLTFSKIFYKVIVSIFRYIKRLRCSVFCKETINLGGINEIKSKKD